MNQRAAGRRRSASPAHPTTKQHATVRRLRERLLEHALGRGPLSATQLRAIEFLLRSSGSEPETAPAMTHEDWVFHLLERERRQKAAAAG